MDVAKENEALRKEVKTLRQQGLALNDTIRRGQGVHGWGKKLKEDGYSKRHLRRLKIIVQLALLLHCLGLSEKD